MLVNYKKRSKQLRFGKICYLFVLLSIVIMFLELSNGLENLEEFERQLLNHNHYNLL